VCNYFQIARFLLHTYSTNQKRVRFKSDKSRYRFYYSAQSTLATIIRKWLLLSQLS